MRVMTTLMVSGLAAGCVPKTGDVADTSWRTQTPEPLAPRAFQLPEAQTAPCPGVEVSVVENHEMPLVNVRVAFDQGAWTDSADAVGLASVTLDMLNEGAGEYDAAGISKAAKVIAANLSSGASADSASVSVGVLSKNLAPALDLLSTVVLEPTFEQDDWDLMKMDRIAGLASARNNPRSIAGRVSGQLQYGDAYKGLLKTEEYEAMTTDAMKAWWSTHPGGNAHLCGRRHDVDAVLPLLGRFGGWGGEASTAEANAVLPNVEHHHLPGRQAWRAAVRAQRLPAS